MNDMVKTFNMRLQSAMEYLMTYGWAILIIGVVVVALFGLGILSNPLGTVCLPLTGYLCSAPSMVDHGSAGGAGGGANNAITATNIAFLTFTFGQNTGQAMYNVLIAVTAESNTLTATGLPSGTVLSPGGSDTNVVNNAASGFTSGQTTTAYIGMDNNQVTNNAIGQTFSGFVWIAYNTGSLTGSPNYAKVGTLIAKIS